MIGRVLCATVAAAALCGYPAFAATPLGGGGAGNVTWHKDGVLTWERVEHRAIAPPTVHRLTPALQPGASKVVAHGAPGLREVDARYAQRDGGSVTRVVLWSSVVRVARPRVVEDGIGYSPLAAFEARGVARMAFLARDAMEMVATAYTAGCGGCDGMTAIGRRAGHGIVAVDPRVIPLGTRLYILGYGPAIAGDTGGAIVGHRIDLGFDSLRDAMLFGRRDVTVYRLK
ncbi:MAG: G5 domain-containing protein [Candidatus Eremiobacteraeota bacterium]|nr:G5 domain-containing protein [Candidatus Eremiobacteraeota bacterium]MBV8498440.1 G5 domain-containing protein [Candidatus Eremiobacteraeota bacterium]